MSLLSYRKLLIALIGLAVTSCSSGYRMTREAADIYNRIDQMDHIRQAFVLENTPYQTPVFYFDSGNPGNTVMILGGTHGNEPAGYEAALRLVRLLQQNEPVAGKVILIPLANRMAVKDYERRISVPEDAHYEQGNLNRCYPGNRYGLAMEKMAYAIQQIAMQNDVDVFIDLHEARYLHLNTPEESYRERGLGQTIIYYPNESSSWFMINILDAVNESIAEADVKFSSIEKPIKNSAAWWAGQYLHAAAFTFETSRTLPLQDRIRYQLLMVQNVFQQADIWNRDILADK